MLDVLSKATLSILRFSRCAFASSSCLMRWVATRHGRTILTVTPSLPTSFASVFDQPRSPLLKPFDIARLGIGAITPDDVLVIIRPHFPSRILGNTRFER